MKPEYQIADLTKDQQQKLEQYQQEFGKILIAWESDANGQNSEKR